MRRSLGFVLALPLVAALAAPAGAGMAPESHRPPAGPRVVTTDKETPVLYDDAAGVDVYYGHGASGYVIVSSQGDDRYAVYSTTGGNRSLGTFVVRGVGVDDLDGSDGLAVTNRPVGHYRQGLLVSHDEPETGPAVDEDRDATNFSYVDWADIAEALKLQVSRRSATTPGSAEPA
jgi:3-phytase